MALQIEIIDEDILHVAQSKANAFLKNVVIAEDEIKLFHFKDTCGKMRYLIMIVYKGKE